MGKIYIVATPIGNLADISQRALDVLGSVDLILSEDTRETEKVLKAHDISTPQISYRDENHNKVFPHILEQLQLDKSVALVSDNGTPLISDPGFKLIRHLRKYFAEVSIIPIPGPSAVTAALSVSGLPADNFSFLGFLPRKTSQRRQILVEFGGLPTTLVLYESPYRVRKLLKEVSEALGNRVVCLAKDLTKKYEEVKTADLQAFLSTIEAVKEKGEYVVLIAKEGFEL